LFEAAPFALLASCVPARFGRLVGLVGCGCSGAFPGAFAPASIALCWMSFGPGVALARVAGGALVGWIVSRRRRPCDGAPADSRNVDPLGELGTLAASAAAAALLVDTFGRHVPGGPAGIAIGLAIGVLAPCATASVAIATGLAPHAPLLAAALLATAGIVPRPASARRPPAATEDGTRGGRFALCALALALGTLTVRGPCGLVNPRLVPLAGSAAIVALLRAGRGRPAAVGAGVPGLMLAAIVFGSPVPADSVSDLVAVRGFPGEAVRFTGVLHANRVTRFAIACCRIDAVAIGLELDRRPVEPDGSWIAVDARLAQRRGRLLAIPERIRRVRPPTDPFVYL
jgi:hypothetical protein